MCSDQWDALAARKESQGAIMLFDHEIGRQKGQSPLAAIVLKGFPPDVGVNSNFTELVIQAACHQMAYAIDSLRKIKTDCQGVLKHAEKELTKGNQRFGGPAHGWSLRQVKTKCRNLKRTHTKAHPEKSGRSPAMFTAKEARIYAADIRADPGTECVAMTNSKKAMSEGLKYNIVPDFVYYVDVNDILEGLYEPGDHFLKKEDGPIRVHNSANLTEHVMSEYLAERTKISKSSYQWDKSEMGFLASVWGKKKYMPCSKKKAQQHILDKKSHGRNLKKGDEAFETLCPLCAQNDETQAHLLLRCEHPIMVYWRRD
jgi:hypothetical protein